MPDLNPTRQTEVALWQWRWMNPGNDPNPGPDVEWKTVEPRPGQSLEERLDELRSYRYCGKPCYELRPLFAEHAPDSSHLIPPSGVCEGNAPKLRLGPEAFEPAIYWSSTQYSAYNAWCQPFDLGSQSSSDKKAEARARAVRRLIL
jgi:hypothetical protein